MEKKLFLLEDHSGFGYVTQKELIELCDSVIIKLFQFSSYLCEQDFSVLRNIKREN